MADGLHLAEIGSTFWLKHHAFRDYLTHHPGERQAYEALKLELATRHPANR